ncbi:MAG: hypothetical protein OdinLCB4_000605 [Candidatus Odinarchaeum yellowstonii]|uniref:Winged helix-turn-helix domain-containing protein n=1 Tax=Odinarchaeota yellowstonii (strain LCB_4) TaxID=1841599 RepID=A0AAF0ICA9_ODILC|nr:MAG: hypothetical protein OdinLCB4_000605 [Candidatus Odinarchaeum yellowstonii]
MRVKSSDILVINELQRNPYQSIRFLARNLRIKKDRVFRSLKKFRERFRLEEAYYVNYPLIGLKPFITLVECRYQKAENVTAALKNPYLLELYKCVGGEAIYIIGKYACPETFNIKPVLGLMRSWNWVKESYIAEIRSEKYNISFHYFDYLNQNWDIKWLYWGLMIRDFLINRDISELFPNVNMVEYESEKNGYNSTVLKNIEFLTKLVSNPGASVKQLAASYNSIYNFYNLKKFFIKSNLIKMFYKIDWRSAGLRERVAVIVKTEDEKVSKSVLNGFLTLPECNSYIVRGDLNGIVFILSLPYGGVCKIHNIFTDYLFDKIDSYWLLPVFEEKKFSVIPPLTLLDKELVWKSIPVLKDKKIVFYKDS